MVWGHRMNDGAQIVKCKMFLCMFIWRGVEMQFLNVKYLQSLGLLTQYLYLISKQKEVERIEVTILLQFSCQIVATSLPETSIPLKGRVALGCPLCCHRNVILSNKDMKSSIHFCPFSAESP